MRIAVLLLVTTPGLVFAQQMNCDCTQILGACEASIRAKPRGEAGSYGADLTITSTAPICSKVSYYVDNTPYFTILSRGNTDQDSVFGTKPFTQETLTDIRCQICKTHVVGAPAQPPAPSAQDTNIQPPALTLSGKWAVFHRSQCDGSTWNWTLILTQSGPTLRGHDTPPLFFQKSNFDGEVTADGQVVLQQRSAPLPGISADSTLRGSVSPDGKRISGVRTGSRCAIDFTMTRN